ncbi:MAG: L-aspartate oxidase [Capsulimonadaceae bacterium]
MKTYDFLVLGSGSAGLTFALRVCGAGSVALVTKKERTDSNTNWAQGGIAGVMGADDSDDLHVSDTLIAGADLCNEQAVRILVSEGPQRIRELIDFGANFNRTSDGSLALGREGGHSRRRIIHTADLTGREVERTLVDALKAHPNITVLEHHFAVDLIIEDGRCLGALVFDEAADTIEPYAARATLIATGGAGQVYQFTTNPPIATGDGIAMAWRAGAEVRNMEFIQFHPTSLYHPDAHCFLISEAVRGEGGILRRKDGAAFMGEYDSARKDLAPRDIVARAIDNEIKRSGDDCVYLDVTHLPADDVLAHFPTIYSRCLSYGIDITTDWIPVVPAAHYSCGGVATDLVGRTSLDRLYASGEAASTGVHGANRLASNSLLEALVFSRRAADDALASVMTGEVAPLPTPCPAWDAPRPSNSDVEGLRHRLKVVMQKYVGIVRTDARLQKAAGAIVALRYEAASNLGQGTRVASALELRNMLDVADLIVRCARLRQESRGLHYNTDHPLAVHEEKHDTVITRGAE